MIESATAVCPFCNAVLPPLATAAAEQRLPCPRCGEAVPADRWVVKDLSEQVREGLPPVRGLTPESAPVPGRRKTAITVLAIMAIMASLAVGFALWTTKARRARDPKPALDTITVRRPLQLPAMGFLPRDPDIVIGLQIAECLNDTKAGRPLLDEPRPAGLEWVIKQVTRVTGMELKDLDHVLVAATLDAKSPQLTLIVRTRRSLSLEKIADARPVKSSLHADLPLYEFDLNPVGGLLIWCVESKTALCVVRLDRPTAAHLADLSKTPRAIKDVLAEPMRQALEQRLSKHQFAWAVGRLDRLDALTKALAFTRVGPAPGQMLKDMRLFALGLEPIEGLTLNGHFLMRDAKAAAAFKKTLDGIQIDGTASQKTDAAPPQEAPWVTWQLRGNPAVLRGLLLSRPGPGRE